MGPASGILKPRESGQIRFTTRGLAMAAGWVDSALGAHAAMDNNGFSREATALPTTDVARMVKFFEGELLDVARSDLTLTMKHPSVAQSTPNRCS